MTDHQNRGIGDNNGPSIEVFTSRTKLAHIDRLIERTDLNSKQKCVGVRLILNCDRDGQASATTADLQRAASAGDRRTVFSATKELHDKGIVRKTSTNGQSGAYTVLPVRVVDEIAAAAKELSNKRAEEVWSELVAENDTGPDSQPVTKNVTGSRGPVTLGATGQNAEPVAKNDTGDKKPNRIFATGDIEPHRSEESSERTSKESPSEILLPLENINIPTEPSKDEKGSRALSRPKPTEDQFVRFWEAYPKREGKAKARENFFKLTPEDAERAVLAAAKFASEVRSKGTESKFVKWAEGWLSARRFEDYETDDKPWWKGREADLSSLDETFWRRLIAKHANGVWDARKICLPPGHPNCPLPKSLIADMRLLEVYGPSQSHKWRGME